MDESMRIQIFEESPSALEFETRTEVRNVPAVFIGCVKDWRAFSKWNPVNGGLQYLQERVGSSIVEAMLSRSAPVFYGDLRNHERVPLPFSAFIDLCKQHMQNKSDGHGFCFNLEKPGIAQPQTEHACILSVDDPQQVYLAQVPIMSAEDVERVQLQTLREDIQIPALLETKELASINLWMNNALARSSTHYDPHHNLLCIIAGRKEVVLWPPSASPFLYPMPIYGEASNHSSVALEEPNFSVYPRAECSMEHSQKVILHAGDALFIPEGWFHQVDSDDLTIAVNFWWRSKVMCSMSEHMDSYYLRRILRRLTDREMNQTMQKVSSTVLLPEVGEVGHSNNYLPKMYESKDSTGEQQRIMLHELEPLASKALHELISLVHEHVNVSNQCHAVTSTSKIDSAVSVKVKSRENVTANLFCMEDDLVAKVLWSLPPYTLQNVFLAMAYNFPRTLEALILHLLSPVGAEVLTRKFDEMDQQTSEGARKKFYEVFYGVFDDQFAAMDAILNGKESFAHQAFNNVLDKYLGVNFNGTNP